jgi:LPPG:FO 2-phospho-L-lactate transferase
MSDAPNNKRYLALSGGVGGAKLALGLTHVLSPDQLQIVVNTGDDFEHLGLTICPDLDTLLYTLSGLANPKTGWGRASETNTFMKSLEALGGDTWFFLGDGDLALHVERSQRLRAGQTLSEVTAALAKKLGVTVPIFPMTDDIVRTVVDTPDGPLPFQHYFVRDQCAPTALGFQFTGAEDASPHPEFSAALQASNLDAIFICPSNPFVSVDPILALPGIREFLGTQHAPLIAVSPIIGGSALKGPAAKMMAEMGLDVSAVSVAQHYGTLLDGFVLDQTDAALEADVRALGPEVLVTNTVMTSLDDRIKLARDVIEFSEMLQKA